MKSSSPGNHQKMSRYRFNLVGLAMLSIATVLAAAYLRPFPATLLVYAYINAIAAVGLCLLFGFAGQISIGQAAFFGMGAYITANLTMKFGVAPILALAGAVIATGVFGWAISRPILRLSANYLAMGTLALGSIAYTAFAAFQSLTGGLDPGIVGVPPFSVRGVAFKSPSDMLMVTGIALVIVLLIALSLVHSRIGRALRALRTSEVAAASLGVDVVQYKSAIFGIAAGMAGLAGALFAYFQSSFNASVFGVGLSIELLVIIIVGSSGTPWGALFGALIVTILPNLLEDFEAYKLLAYGLVMTVVMIYMPRGLGAGIIRILGMLPRRRALK